MMRLSQIMLSTTYNDWFKWYYDDNLFSRKQHLSSNLKIKFDAAVTSYLPLKDEIKRNAIKTLECFPNKKISVLFSGGADSELAARTFKDLDANMCAYIFRYENDVNLYDVSYAVTIAEMYNIPYKLIDFDILNFYKKDAERVSEISQLTDPRALPQLKFIDYIDDESLVIGGGGDAVWRRLALENYKNISDQTQIIEDTDYDKKGSWFHVTGEIEIGWDRYVNEINRTAIMSWLKFTPEMYLAQMTTEWARKLIHDGYKGKLGINSTKLLGWREVYPDMVPRTKKYGLEKIEPLLAEYREFLIKKYNGYYSNRVVLKTINDIFSEITNNPITI